MAIHDKLTDRISNTAVVQDSVAKAVDRKVNKVDTNNEFNILAELKQSSNVDVSHRYTTSHYTDIFKALGFEITKEDYKNNYLHDLANNQLPFYTKHLSTSIWNVIRDSKNEKVLDNSFTIFKDNEDNVIDIDDSTLTDVVNSISTYGKTLVVNSETDTDNELPLINILPFRYRLIDNEVHILTFLDTKKINGSYRNIYRYLKVDGNLKSEKVIHLNNKGQVVVLENEETTINYPFIYNEFNSVEKSSDLWAIRNEILNIDLIETVKMAEVKGTQFRIHAEQGYFEDGKVLMQDVYRVYSEVNGALDRKPLFEQFQPNIRAEEYDNIITSFVQRISNILGMSARSLGISSSETKVATVALLDEDKTAHTINKNKRKFIQDFENFLSKYPVDYNFNLGMFINSSLSIRTEIAQKLKNNVSQESLIRFIYPEYNEEQVLNEVVKTKIEQGILMTKEEEEYAIENNLIENVARSLGV